MKIIGGLLFFLVSVSFFGCQEENDCVGCNLNPKIKIKFEATTTKALADSLLTGVKDKINIIRDSLSKDLDAMDSIELVEELTLLQMDSLKYDEMYNLLRIGKTKIDAIDAPGAMNMEQFQDTIIRSFALPVNMYQDTSTFYFTYYDHMDTLQLYYQREVIQNLEGVRMKINGIGVDKEISTFDSVRVKCYNSDCANDRTTVYIYF